MFYFVPGPGARMMPKYCRRTKSCDQIGHLLRSVDFHSLSMFQRWREAENRQSSTVLSDPIQICWIIVIRRCRHDMFLCLTLRLIYDNFPTCTKVSVVMCNNKNPTVQNICMSQGLDHNMIVSWVPLVMEKCSHIQQTVHSQDPCYGYFNRMCQAI